MDPVRWAASFMKSISLLLLLPLVAMGVDIRLPNAPGVFVTGVTNASGNAVYTARAVDTVPSNGQKVLCHFPMGGEGQAADSFRTRGTVRERTITSRTSTTFQLLAEDGSTPIPFTSTATGPVAMDTGIYGFCSPIGTYTYRSDIGGLIPPVGSTERTRITAGTETASTDSPTRYAALISAANTYSTSGCDGSNSASCTTEEANIAAINYGFNADDDKAWGQRTQILMMACLITGTTRYCNAHDYWVRNLPRWRESFGDYGAQHGGRGSSSDWSYFANRNAALSISAAWSRLSAGERTTVLNQMLTGVGESCTPRLDLTNPTTTADGTTGTITVADATGFAVGKHVYVLDYRNTFSNGDGLTSLVVSSGVGTITTASNSSIINAGQEIIISGSATSALNGTKDVLSTGNPFTFDATGVSDGTYTDATVTLLRNFGINQSGQWGKITAVSGTTITTTIAWPSGRSAINAPVFLDPGWSSGICGGEALNFMHGYTLPLQAWKGTVRFTGAITEGQTVLDINPNDIHNATASRYLMVETPSGNNEIMGITSIDTGASTITVTRGQLGTVARAFTPISSTVAYTSDYPLANSTSTSQYRWFGDPSNNLAFSKVAGAFQVGLILGQYDARALQYAERMALWWHALVYRHELAQNGQTRGGSSTDYHLGRFIGEQTAIDISIRNTLVTYPDWDTTRLKNTPLFEVMRLMPNSTDCQVSHISDSGSTCISSEDDMWAFPILFSKYPSWPGWGQWWTYYDAGPKTGTEQKSYLPWLTYTTETAISAAKAAYTAIDPYAIFRPGSTEVAQESGYFTLASRTGWTADSSLMWFSAFSSPVDHISIYNPPGGFVLVRDWRELLAPSNQSTRLANTPRRANNVLCVPQVQPSSDLDDKCSIKQAGLAFMGGSDFTVESAYASSAARYASLNCASQYISPVNACTQRVLHAGTDAQDYTITLSRIGASSSTEMYHQLSYYGGYTVNGSSSHVAQSPVSTLTLSGTQYTYRQNQHGFSVLTDRLYTTAGAALSTVSPNYSTEWGHRARAKVTGTDLEALVIHTSVAGTVATHPTATLLTSDATHHAVQVDSTPCFVGAIPRTGSSATSLTYTTTHSGTCPQTVAGLSAGNYDVTRNGSAVGTYTAVDGVIEFSAASGDIAISESAAPPSGTGGFSLRGGSLRGGSLR